MQQYFQFSHHLWFLMSDISFPTPLHVPMESEKTVAGRPSCLTAGLIGKMSLLSCPAPPETLPARTSTATPAPPRPPPSSAAHKSARPGPSWLTTSRRIASTMRTSRCLLHVSRPRSVYRSARTCAPPYPITTYSLQLPAFSLPVY